MCVIIVADEKGPRPSEEMLRDAWHANKDGAGFAWREQRKGKTVVCFKKGIMKEDEAIEFAKKLPLPYVAHFRIASVGGVRKSLTHPFLVSPTVKLELEGTTTGGVLFHNGHWGVWNEKALDAAIASNSKIPTGDWSDTRAMAWLVNIYGPGFMDLLPSQKGVLFTPDDMEIFTGPGWDQVQGIWCSNDSFTKRYRGGNHTGYSGHGSGSHGNRSFSKYCSNGTCTNPPLPGKTLCMGCDSSIATAVAAAKAADAKDKDKEDHTSSTSGTKPSAVNIVTGTNRPQTRLSLVEAENLHKVGKLSKRMLKKFRKEYEFIGVGGKREEKAHRALLRLTSDIAERLLAG